MQRLNQLCPAALLHQAILRNRARKEVSHSNCKRLLSLLPQQLQLLVWQPAPHVCCY
jgi:hypothetical protein